MNYSSHGVLPSSPLYIHVRLCVHTSVSAFVYLYTCVHVFVCVYIHVSMLIKYVHVRVYAFVHLVVVARAKYEFQSSLYIRAHTILDLMGAVHTHS